MICDHAIQIDIRKLARQVPHIPEVIDFEGERIVITWTPLNFGGRRPWFLCPSCDRRCAIVYRHGGGPLWGCRVCMRGRYACEHQSLNDRKLLQAFKIRARLGQARGGVVAPFPEKPPRMHWTTYFKIRWKALKLEQEIWAAAERRLSGD